LAFLALRGAAKLVQTESHSSARLRGIDTIPLHALKPGRLLKGQQDGGDQGVGIAH
jgi:hypothetical protein